MKPRCLVNGLLYYGEVQAVVSGAKNRDVRQYSEVQQRELHALLMRYDAVFQEPKGLPPKRKKEHAIVLVEGQGPVNVRPYRYPTTTRMRSKSK